jgi:serine/threonine protein kinase
MDSDSKSRCDTKVLPPRVATGHSLKQFKLESVLGEGGMGVVYRAYDTRLYRPVAIKLLPHELTSDADRKQRFLQEARAAARITHPAIAQIFDVDEQDGVTFLVMELVEGKTVRELIKGGGLDLLGIIDVVIQVAEGLARAHELGIVHRDIKPANVMVTPDGHVKILDFGLAKLLDRNAPVGSPTPLGETAELAKTTVPGVLMGTAAYMSPEQARGVTVDGRADIFSVGVLLFEMATGKSPFQRDSFMDSLHAVAFENPPSLSSSHGHLPEELQRIVSRCLRKDTDERYPDARVLARDLRELRRNTEAGVRVRTSWRVRLADSWERISHLHPSQYIWLLAGAGAAGAVIYLSLARVSTVSLFFLTIVGLSVVRHVRNRPQRAQETFVRRLTKIPEVRLITLQSQQFTVVVDRPVAQLYSRINHQLKACNGKLYFGHPMTVSILHGLDPERTRELLSGPGVQFVREDVLHN